MVLVVQGRQVMAQLLLLRVAVNLLRVHQRRGWRVCGRGRSCGSRRDSGSGGRLAEWRARLLLLLAKMVVVVVVVLAQRVCVRVKT